MYKAIAIALLAWNVSGQVHAQTQRELAHTLAQATVDVEFRDLKPRLDSAVDIMEKAANENNPYSIPTSNFIAELRKAIRRDNLIVVIGNVLARDMTHEELQETLKFVQSPAGKKFSLLTISVKDKDFGPILREACEHTKKILEDLGIRDPLVGKEDCTRYN